MENEDLQSKRLFFFFAYAICYSTTLKTLARTSLTNQ